MKKRYYLLRGGLGVLLMLIYLTSYAQLQLVPYAKLHKDISNPNGENGALYTFLKYTSTKDSLSWYGNFTSVDFYDLTGTTVAHTVTGNAIRRKNGVWSAIGTQPFKSMFSAILGSAAINGKEYLATQQFDKVGELAANVSVLDPSSKTFNPVSALSFSSGVLALQPLRNGTVFVLGDFYTAKDAVSGERVFSGSAFWNTKTNALSQLPDLKDWSSEVEPHGIYGGAPDSTFVYTGYGSKGFHVLYPASTESQESLYPALPTRPGFNYAEIAALKVVSKSQIYMVVLHDADNAIFVRLKGTPGSNASWETLATFAKPGPTTQKMVLNMALSNGQIYFSGNYATIDGKEHSNVVAYDEKKDAFTDLPRASFAIEKNTLHSFDGNVYQLDDRNLIFGEETVYTVRTVPRDTVPTPTIARIDPLQKVSSVSIAGTGKPQGNVMLFDNSKALSVVQIGSDGSWNATVSLADGFHAVYAKSYKDNEIPSGPTPTVSFAVDANGPMPPTILSLAVSIVRDNQLWVPVTLSAVCPEKKSTVSVYIDDEKNPYPLVNNTYRRTFNGLLSVQTHTARFVATDSVGHVSQFAVREFSTNTLADVNKPGNGGFAKRDGIKRTMSLYPNPASNSVTIASTTDTQISTVLVYGLTGRIVSSTRSNGTSSAQIDVSRFQPGTFAVVATDKSGATEKIQLIKN